MAYQELTTNEGVGFTKNIDTREEFFLSKLPDYETNDPNNTIYKNIAGIIRDNEVKKLAKESRIIPKFMLDRMIRKGHYMQPRSYQHFIRNYINPNTPYKRLLIKWETGIGKTFGALYTAMPFINYYRRESERGSLEIGSVFIIGFTQNIFKKELLKYPEFGFISRVELQKLAHLKKIISRGTKADFLKLQEFIIKIKKRFSNRKKNGFFKFYGYKEFVNRIFLLKDKNINLNALSEHEILENLKTGKIQFNEELLHSFKNSLLICDEIHNVYNSADKNNWGVALQSVLNHVDSLRAVFLSATPLNNSPTEIIDLMNLLLPKEDSLTKEEYFSNIKTGELRPGALDKIKKLSIGRISFIRDTNPLYFPSKKYIGTSIPGIDYLKFTRCPMSEFQYNTYKNMFEGTLSQDTLYIIDFALPNPNSTTQGLYQTRQIKTILASASQAWKEKNRIDIKNGIIIGDFMEMDTLKKYSNKYFTMMAKIKNLISIGGGKIFIYHNIVHMSGILFIQEVLKKNGVIPEFGTPSDNTLCVICGKIMREHKKCKEQGNPATPIKNKKTKDKKQRKGCDHNFMAARFIIAHSDIEKSQIIKSIDRYNNPNNSEGHSILILLGSKLIKESYDIKCVRNMFIMRRPDNMSTLIQIIGRTVRQNSHIDLPVDQRNVDINIFTSCLPIKSKGFYEKSYEEIKYGEKINSYKIIQNIEKKFHETAIDMAINKKLLFDRNGRLKSSDPLGPLNFKPDFSFSTNPKIQTSTFETFYEAEQMNTIIAIIKRLFIEQDVAWTYEQLWDAVKNPPRSWVDFINIDTKLLRESNFQIALTRVLWISTTFPSDKLDAKRNKVARSRQRYTEPIISRTEYTTRGFKESIESEILQTLSSPDDKIIILPNGQKSIVTQLGPYYCLVSLNELLMEPLIDIEVPYRSALVTSIKNINIKNYLENRSHHLNYNRKKMKFKMKYENVSLEDMEDAVCDYGTDFHKIFMEETIAYIFNILTGYEPTQKSEFHDFYFKMLYYYNIMGLVIWASTAKKFIANRFTKFITSNKMHSIKQNDKIKNNIKKIKKIDNEGKKKVKKKELGKVINKDKIMDVPTKSEISRILKSSIGTGACWCPEAIAESYYSALATSLELVETHKRKRPESKVPASMLPIGHFLLEIPRFLSLADKNQLEWIDVPGYVSSTLKSWQENPLIIGYDSKSATGIHIRFKLRSPIQDIKKFKDTRKIEKGSICSSKSKEFLLALASDLKITLPKKLNVLNLCNAIRAKMIYNEILERNKPDSKVKWFYAYYEKTPAL